MKQYDPKTFETEDFHLEQRTFKIGIDSIPLPLQQIAQNGEILIMD